MTYRNKKDFRKTFLKILFETIKLVKGVTILKIVRECTPTYIFIKNAHFKK